MKAVNSFSFLGSSNLFYLEPYFIATVLAPSTFLYIKKCPFEKSNTSVPFNFILPPAVVNLLPLSENQIIAKGGEDAKSINQHESWARGPSNHFPNKNSEEKQQNTFQLHLNFVQIHHTTTHQEFDYHQLIKFFFRNSISYSHHSNEFN